MTSFTSSRSPVFEWESGLHPEDWNSSVQRRLSCSALSSHFSEWVTCDVLSTCCSVVPVTVVRGKMVGSAVLRNNSMNWLKFISNFGMDNHFHFRSYLVAWLRESHRNVRTNPSISLKPFVIIYMHFKHHRLFFLNAIIFLESVFFPG